MIFVKARFIVTVVLLGAVTHGYGNDIRYTITDLGVLNGAPSNGGSYATAMNNLGEVVGHGDTTVLTASGYVLAEHAFLFAGSGPLLDLGTFGTPPNDMSAATAINNSGMVCGYSDSIGTASPTRAFVYTPSGGMQDLPIFPGGQTRANDINDLGQIVGSATLADGSRRSFLYSANGPLVELDPTRPPFFINDAGEVVSTANTASHTVTTYISNGGTGAATNIGSLGGSFTQPAGLNNRGDIVGFSTTDISGTMAGAFLYSGGTMADLGSFGGTENSANGINDSGIVVGYSSLSGNTMTHAFIYDASGSMQDLNGLIDPTLGWTLGSAVAINARGQIAAAGGHNGGPAHALLLTPIPEPSSLCLVSGAVIALFMIRTCARLLPAADPIRRSFLHSSCAD